MTKKHTNLTENTIKHANKLRHEIRKKEYAVVDEAWIKSMLSRSLYGSVATVHEAQPFLTPILFLYIEEEHALYFHGATVGRLRANIEINPNVCFNVTEVGRILPYEQAVEFTIEYHSVTVFGQAELVDGKKEVARILQRIMDKYAPHLKPGEDYIPAQTEDINRTLIGKINIEDWTGKQQVDDGESINPYYYEPMPLIRSLEE
jgi:nitroimidazol reductase NimA-like FMN-containing flavoprotein (pyridoxamine 5'-phosphate oxidase superfamily)